MCFSQKSISTKIVFLTLYSHKYRCPVGDRLVFRPCGLKASDPQFFLRRNLASFWPRSGWPGLGLGRGLGGLGLGLGGLGLGLGGLGGLVWVVWVAVLGGLRTSLFWVWVTDLELPSDHDHAYA